MTRLSKTRPYSPVAKKTSKTSVRTRADRNARRTDRDGDREASNGRGWRSINEFDNE